MLSEVYGGEAMKGQVFLSGINGSKRVMRTCKMMKEVVIQDLTGPMKINEKVRNPVHSDSYFSIRAMDVQLILDTETV